jgi:hypothetical protein
MMTKGTELTYLVCLQTPVIGGRLTDREGLKEISPTIELLEEGRGVVFAV